MARTKRTVSDKRVSRPSPDYSTPSAALADGANLSVGDEIVIGGKRGDLDTFEVTDSAAETDGGTVFIFDEDLSAEQEIEDTSSKLSSNDWPDSDLSWRSFEYEYGTGLEDVCSALRFSGLAAQGSNTGWLNGRADVDFKAGKRLFSKKMDNYQSQFPNSYGSKAFVRYKYATSNRRLERKTDDYVRPKWWGAPVQATGKLADSHIRWALRVAERIKDAKGLNVAYCEFALDYLFASHIFQRDEIEIRGRGPHKSDGATRAELRIQPGSAAIHRRTAYSLANDWNRDRAEILTANEGAVIINGNNGETRGGLNQLRFDGGLLENLHVWNNRGNYDDIKGYAQNSGNWQAWYQKVNYAEAMDVNLQDVVVVNCGGSCVAAATNMNGRAANFNVDNLTTDTSRRNHLLYGIVGKINDITLQGHYWGGNPLSIGVNGPPREVKYTNITFKDLEPNPQFLMGGMLTDRRGAVELDGVRVNLAASVMRDPNGIKILTGDDQGTSMKNAEIDTLKPENAINGAGNPMLLYDQRSRSQDFHWANPSVFQNIDVTDQGVGFRLLSGVNRSGYQDVVLKSISVNPASGVSGSVSDHPYNFVMDNELSNSITKARRIEARNIDYQREFDGERGSLIHFSFTKGSGTHPFDFFGIDSEYAGGGWSKVIEYQLPADAKWADTRVFLDNTTLNQTFGDVTTQRLNPSFNGGVVRMRDVTTNSGPSDESGTYTATSTDQSNGYALIPTSLLSRARETDVTANAGYSVTGVEVANSDGTLRADDNTGQSDPHLKVSVDGSITQGDTFDWTARVTPTSMYSTTGLFVAREVSDQSYTSGNGPFGVDLRGTFSSQESGERIVYSASSSDSSVATVSIATGNVVMRSLTEPTERRNGEALKSGDIWIEWEDTETVDSATLYRYDGSQFVSENNLSATVSRVNNFPSNPSSGDYAVRFDKGLRTWKYNGSSWVEQQPNGYDLTITEQSAGTATITVDAEIPGVGTAQTSFDVEIQ
jgi:hypothetical protein